MVSVRQDHRTHRRPAVPRRLRLLIAPGVVLLVVLPAVLVLYRGFRASIAATEAKAALLRAETNLRAAKLDESRADLERAKAEFARTRREIRGLGPLLPVTRAIPFVRIQVRGAQAFADAGLLLCDAGLHLTETAESLAHPADQNVRVVNALEPLRSLQESLHAGSERLDAAIDKVASLNGFRLIGPLAQARNDLVHRLPLFEERAASARSALSALLAFAGGSGPRHYLFLSQNPAEVRPTGGFIGTYGVLSAADGNLSLDRYDSIESWTQPRPKVAVPPAEAGSPFPFLSPPRAQTLANINTIPDWPRVAKAAAAMWREGGEEPIDGVLSISTGFLARLLGVLGPTTVDEYGETVTAENVRQRIDFYVRKPVPNRKDFVAALAEVVLRRLLDTPAPRWRSLATALAEGFDEREVLAWSGDAAVTGTLAERGWDGTLPAFDGDFFFDAHFAFAAKNGLGVKRTYEHEVTPRADGSGRVTTTITIENTQPADPLNPDSLGYITIYGPTGGALDPTSEVPVAIEPSLADHPAAGFFRAAPPLGNATLKVSFEVPNLLQKGADGGWDYRLLWRRVPDHSGDVLKLKVQLPPGWQWRGLGPPESVELTRDVHGTWPIEQVGTSRGPSQPR